MGRGRWEVGGERNKSGLQALHAPQVQQNSEPAKQQWFDELHSQIIYFCSPLWVQAFMWALCARANHLAPKVFSIGWPQASPQPLAFIALVQAEPFNSWDVRGITCKFADCPPPPQQPMLCRLVFSYPDLWHSDHAWSKYPCCLLEPQSCL